VTPGQEVHRGDVVGLVGSTGKSTGPHLHLEVRVFGVPVDPRPYIAS
jgi:murein DD-endopeptidase MepM/ murein hydrolase activator NlpD